MPNGTNETFGERVKGGAAWGLGFALVATPVAGLLGLMWHYFTDDDENPYDKIPADEREAIMAYRLARSSGMTFEEARHAWDRHQRRHDDDGPGDDD